MSSIIAETVEPVSFRSEFQTFWASGTLGARFAKGAAWSLVGTGISQGLTLVSSLVTARLLGKTAFGQLGMINSTVGMFGVFAGLGLGLTATKYVAELRGGNPDRAGRIIGISWVAGLVSAGLLSAALFLFAPALAGRTLGASYLTNDLRLATALLFFNTIAGVQNGVLAGLEAFRAIALANLAKGLIAVPAAVAGVLLWNLSGAICALGIAAGIGCVVSHAFLHRACWRERVRISYGQAWCEWRVLWNFSLPAFLASSAVSPMTWAANTIIVNQRNGFSEMGLFSAANQWRAALMFVPSIFLQVALPVLSSVAPTSSAASRGQFTKGFELTQSITIAVVFPVGVLLMFLSDTVMRLYGADFTHGVPCLIGVFSTVMIMAVGAATGPAVQSLGRMWLAFFMNLSYGIVMLAFVWLTAPQLGALSLAYGPVVGYCTITIVTFCCLRQQLGSGAFVRAGAGLLLALLLTLVCACISESTRGLLALPVSMATAYVALTVCTPKACREMVRSLLSRCRDTLAVRVRSSR